MLFIAVTKTKKKLNMLIKIFLLFLLLCVLLPTFYGLMLEANSLERFSSVQKSQEEQYPGEPVRVQSDWIVDSVYLEEIANMAQNK